MCARVLACVCAYVASGIVVQGLRSNVECVKCTCISMCRVYMFVCFASVCKKIKSVNVWVCKHRYVCVHVLCEAR